MNPGQGSARPRRTPGVGALREGVGVAGMGHPQGQEDLLPDEVREGAAVRGGDHLLDQGEAVVAVDVQVARIVLEAALPQGGVELVQVAPVRPSLGQDAPDVGAREARGVVEDHPEGDVRVPRGEHAEVREDLRQGAVQKEPAPVHQDHGRHGGDHLACCRTRSRRGWSGSRSARRPGRSRRTPGSRRGAPRRRGPPRGPWRRSPPSAPRRSDPSRRRRPDRSAPTRPSRRSPPRGGGPSEAAGPPGACRSAADPRGIFPRFPPRDPRIPSPASRRLRSIHVDPGLLRGASSILRSPLRPTFARVSGQSGAAERAISALRSRIPRSTRGTPRRTPGGGNPAPSPPKERGGGPGPPPPDGPPGEGGGPASYRPSRTSSTPTTGPASGR
jgi:hypothetical protein